MALKSGDRLGPYEVLAPLGAGGMGEVYRARDTKLDRDVALKILPESVSADPDRLMRFEREAKALATLNHPNIAQIYGLEGVIRRVKPTPALGMEGPASAGPDAGGLKPAPPVEGPIALVMELVDGMSLAERVAQGPVPADEAMALAAQIASALDEAHEKGIVHRDLKPANVMVTRSGRVKVLDFGLAMRVDRDAASDETAMKTEAGAVLGTFPYMSPEQVQGLQVDRRTDIFSLGTMLYEMVSGARPFRGENPAELTSAILRDEPAPVPPGSRVPGPLDTLIRHCLRKRPDDRPSSASAVSEQLRTMASGISQVSQATSPMKKTVVVLPFVNRSGDPDNEYFSDGLTEEVIADLSRVSALRTISRNSSMTLKSTTKNTATIARELGVTHLVTGSVRRAGSALRVTAELVDAGTDASIWSDKYSGTIEDVFGIQEEIARKIVAALQVTLTESESRQVGERPISDTVAYDCYLRARQEMYRWTPDSAERAHRLVDEAMAIVGDVPLLLATKGLLHWNDANTNRVPAAEGLGRATDLAERALAVEADLPLAIYVRGLASALGGRPESALRDLYRAHELAPNDANILTEVCRFSNASGLNRHEPLVRRVGEIDPLTPVTPLVSSTFCWVNGRRDEIAAPARRAIALAPVPSMLHILGAWQIEAAGFRDEAAAILREVAAALVGTSHGAWAAFHERALAGDEAGAMAHLAGTEALGDFGSLMVAEACAMLGRRDDAMRWARTAIEFGFVNSPYLNEHSRHLAALRGDAEFQDVLRGVKSRWEALVAWEQAELRRAD